MRARKGGRNNGNVLASKKIIFKVYLKLNFVYYNELYLCIIYINIYNVSNIWKINKNYNKEQTHFVFDTPEMLLEVFQYSGIPAKTITETITFTFFLGTTEKCSKRFVIPFVDAF